MKPDGVRDEGVAQTGNVGDDVRSLWLKIRNPNLK
jgi:hypothetical protein